MSVDILSAKEARQLTMDSDNKMRNTLKQIERAIRIAAESGFFAMRVRLADYDILPRDIGAKKRVIAKLDSLGYKVYGETDDSFGIYWNAV